MNAAAIILSGGRGERLGGVDKGALQLGGHRLIDRVAARLTGCHPLLVAIGRRAPGTVYGIAEALEVADLATEYEGPLAGVAAAVDSMLRLPDPPASVVCVAVDTPFLPDDYVQRLTSALEHAPAALATCAGQPYPTNSAWRLAALADLPASTRAGTAPHSLRRLAAALGAVDVIWNKSEAGDPFANINTPAERDELERRALSRRT